jgi:histidinol-phosphate aminotransferase
MPENDFGFDLGDLEIPDDTTLAVIVNPNNPNGGTFDMTALPGLLAKYSGTCFLIDEAFIGLSGTSVANLVPRYDNLIVTRTLSKAHSLAGFRVGYAILPRALAEDLNSHNDAYPLARPSQAAAIATLQHEDKIRGRISNLRTWTEKLSFDLQKMGVRTFPTGTYFFLADFTPYDAGDLAERLRNKNIIINPLNDPRLGPGFMRVTTALPEDNAYFLEVLKELL